jgi:transmembrane sensor
VPDERPFVVYADEAVVEILGTEFNVQAYEVQAYEEEEEIQVVVTDGRVAVRHIDAPEDQAAFLERGDMASLRRNGTSSLSVIRDVDLRRHLGWLEYRLEFDGASLDQVVKRLERWYNIDINLADPSLSDIIFTGVFEGESVYEVLQTLQISLDLEYEIQGQEVTLLPRISD